MPLYVDTVMLLNFLVDLFLLMGTNRLCGYPSGPGRCAAAAGIGGVYACGCCMPGFYFLGRWWWRAVSLALIGWVAFGFSKSAVRKTVVFVLLSMALGGIAMGFGNGGFWSLVAAALGLFALCALGFRDKLGGATYIPVELRYGKTHLHLTALRDTGNTLSDPVTGKPVLLVDVETATRLTGLSSHQLERPIEALSQCSLQGMRLIPYHAVGQPNGLLLALRIPEVRIGKWKGSSLVAFSPNGLSREGAYQALTGGVV